MVDVKLRANHPMCAHFTPLSRENFDIRLGTNNTVAEVVAAEVPTAAHNLTNEKQEVLISMKNPDGSSERRYVPWSLL